MSSTIKIKTKCIFKQKNTSLNQINAQILIIIMLLLLIWSVRWQSIMRRRWSNQGLKLFNLILFVLSLLLKCCCTSICWDCAMEGKRATVLADTFCFPFTMYLIHFWCYHRTLRTESTICLSSVCGSSDWGVSEPLADNNFCVCVSLSCCISYYK